MSVASGSQGFRDPSFLRSEASAPRGGVTTSSGKYPTAQSQWETQTHRTAASSVGRSLCSLDDIYNFQPRSTMVAGMAGMLNPDLIPDPDMDDRREEEEAETSEIRMLFKNLKTGAAATWWRDPSQGGKKEVWLNLSDDLSKIHFRSLTQKQKVDAQRKKIEKEALSFAEKQSRLERKQKADEAMGKKGNKAAIAPPPERSVPDRIKNCTLFIVDIEDGEDGVTQPDDIEGDWTEEDIKQSYWQMAMAESCKPQQCLLVRYRDFKTGYDATLSVSFKKAIWESEAGGFEKISPEAICRRWLNGIRLLQFGGAGSGKPSAAELYQLNPTNIIMDKLWVYADESGDGSINAREELEAVLGYCNIKQKRLPRFLSEILSHDPEYKQYDKETIEGMIIDGKIDINRQQFQRLLWKLRNHDLVNQIFAEFSRDRPKMRVVTESTERGFDDFLQEQDSERDIRAKYKELEKQIRSEMGDDAELKSALRDLKMRREKGKQARRDNRVRMIKMVQQHILKYHLGEMSKGKFTTFLMHSSINTAFSPWCISDPVWKESYFEATNGTAVWSRPLRDFYISTSVNTAYGMISNTEETDYLPYGCTKILEPKNAVLTVMTEFNPRAIHIAVSSDLRVGIRQKASWRVGHGGYPESFPMRKKPVAVFDGDAPPGGEKNHPCMYWKSVRQRGSSLREILHVVKGNAFRYSPTPFVLILEVPDGGRDWVAVHNKIARELRDVLGVAHTGAAGHGHVATLGQPQAAGTIVVPDELYEEPHGALADGGALSAFKTVRELGGVGAIPLGLLQNRIIIAVQSTITVPGEWTPITKRRQTSELTRLIGLEMMCGAGLGGGQYNMDIPKMKLVTSEEPTRVEEWEKLGAGGFVAPYPRAIPWPDGPSELMRPTAVSEVGLNDDSRSHVSNATFGRQQSRLRGLRAMQDDWEKREKALQRRNTDYISCWSEEELVARMDTIRKWQAKQKSIERRKIKDAEKAEREATGYAALPKAEHELPQARDYINELHSWTREHLTFATADKEPHHRRFMVGDKVQFRKDGKEWRTATVEGCESGDLVLSLSGRKFRASECEEVKRAGLHFRERNTKWSKWKRQKADNGVNLFSGVAECWSAGVQMVGIEYLPNPHTEDGLDAIALRSLYRSKFRMSHDGVYGFVLKPTPLLSVPVRPTGRQGGSVHSASPRPMSPASGVASRVGSPAPTSVTGGPHGLEDPSATMEFTPQSVMDAGKRWRERGPCTFICRVVSAQYLPGQNEGDEEEKGLLEAINPVSHIKSLMNSSNKAAIVDPFIEVRIDGVQKDCWSRCTRTIQDNGYCPRWDDSWSVPIEEKEHAVITLSVYHDDGLDGRQLLGRGSLPLTACRLGYRAVFLYDASEKRIPTCPTLLCHFREVVAGNAVEKATEIKLLEQRRDDTKMLLRQRWAQLEQLRQNTRKSAKQLTQIRNEKAESKRTRDKYRQAHCICEEVSCVVL